MPPPLTPVASKAPVNDFTRRKRRKNSGGERRVLKVNVEMATHWNAERMLDEWDKNAISYTPLPGTPSSGIISFTEEPVPALPVGSNAPLKRWEAEDARRHRYLRAEYSLASIVMRSLSEPDAKDMRISALKQVTATLNARAEEALEQSGKLRELMENKALDTSELADCVKERWRATRHWQATSAELTSLLGKMDEMAKPGYVCHCESLPPPNLQSRRSAENLTKYLEKSHTKLVLKRRAKIVERHSKTLAPEDHSMLRLRKYCAHSVFTEAAVAHSIAFGIERPAMQFTSRPHHSPNPPTALRHRREHSNQSSISTRHLQTPSLDIIEENDPDTPSTASSRLSSHLFSSSTNGFALSIAETPLTELGSATHFQSIHTPLSSSTFHCLSPDADNPDEPISPGKEDTPKILSPSRLQIELNSEPILHSSGRKVLTIADLPDLDEEMYYSDNDNSDDEAPPPPPRMFSRYSKSDHHLPARLTAALPPLPPFYSLRDSMSSKRTSSSTTLAGTLEPPSRKSSLSHAYSGSVVSFASTSSSVTSAETAHSNTNRRTHGRRNLSLSLFSKKQSSIMDDLSARGESQQTRSLPSHVQPNDGKFLTIPDSRATANKPTPSLPPIASKSALTRALSTGFTPRPRRISQGIGYNHRTGSSA